MKYTREFLASQSVIDLNEIFKKFKFSKKRIKKFKEIRRKEKNRIYATQARNRKKNTEQNEMEQNNFETVFDPYEYLIGHLYC